MNNVIVIILFIFLILLHCLACSISITAVGDHEMKAILASRHRLPRAICGILNGKYNEITNSDVSRLWEFIWLNILPKVYKTVNGKEENSIWSSKYAGDVTAKALMQMVNVSDEALILAVLSVRQETCVIFESDSTSTVSGLSLPDSTQGGSASSAASDMGESSAVSTSASKRKRKTQTPARKKGRSGNFTKKQQVTKKDYNDKIKELSKKQGYTGCKPLPESVATLNDDDIFELEYTVSAEMGKNEQVYRDFYGIVAMGRKGKTPSPDDETIDDPCKWYHTIAEKIKSMKAMVKDIKARELAMLPAMAVGTGDELPSSSVLSQLVMDFEMPDLQGDDANIDDLISDSLFAI